jgi:hypothetical protein
MGVIMNKSKLFFALIFLFSPALVTPLRAADCENCTRRAALVEFQNLHAPDYENQLDEWKECMLQKFGPGSTFIMDDPKLQQALKDCNSLDEGKTDYMWPSSVASFLAEVLNTDCFHMMLPGGPHPPEYLFKGSFDAGITGVTNDRGREIKSRFILKLYYSGSPEELIKTWTTDSTLTDVTSQTKRMFKNPDAAIRQDKPIENLLWDFEKQPSRCDINPDKKELFPGQETRVKISNIVDFEGRKSREFNRIVVQAVSGKIVGGTPVVSDPDLKAFQVGKEDITFTYAAPDAGNSQAAEDKIIVYNSCDILRKDEYPMPKTGIKDKIAEKRVKLIHADAVMTITQKQVQKLEGAKISWNATEKAVLKYKDSLSDEDEGTFTEYYDVKSWKLTDVSANEIDYENNIKQVTDQAEKDDTETPSLSITFDSKTGKAKEIEVPHFAFWFLFHDEINSRLPGETLGISTDIKGGDGIHTMEGGGTQRIGSVTYEENWNIKRYRIK